MIEIGFLITLHLITFLYGIGIMRFIVIKEEIHKYWPIIFSIGYALLPVFITLSYSWGAEIYSISYGIIIGSFIFGIIGIIHFKFYLKKEYILILIGYIFIIILLLSPKLIGGDQFSIFQGNIYDHFNYLTSSIIFSIYDHTTVESATVADFLHDPLLIIPKTNLESRPSVMLFFSALGYLFGSKYLELAYIYNLFFLLQVALVLAWISGYFGVNLRKGLLIGLLFSGGFWGQLIFDMNAWSHLASLPLLILFVSISLKQLSISENHNLTPFTLVFFSITGSLYLYPEATLFLGFGITILTLTKIRSNFSAFKKLTIAALMAICVAIFDFQSTLLFLVNQIHFSLGETPNWYQYYFSFLFGNDGISETLKTSIQNRIFDQNFFQLIITELLDSIPGVMGLFFLTPSVDFQIWNAWILRLLINGFIVGLWIVFVREIWQWITENDSNKNILSKHWVIYLAIQIILILILLLSKNIWSATKGWLYIIPFLMFLFFIPLFSIERSNSASKNLLVIFIITQLAFAGIRPFAASAKGGIHYNFKPYPGSLPQAEKTQYSWDTESLSHLTKDCKMVLIPKINNPFYEHFIMLVLKQNNIAFQKITPVNRYYNESEDIGKMEINGTDCKLQLNTQHDQNILINIRKN